MWRLRWQPKVPPRVCVLCGPSHQKTLPSIFLWNYLSFFCSNFCSQRVALETTWESLSTWERNNEDLYLRSAVTPSLLPFWTFTSLCVTFPVKQKRALKCEPRWPRWPRWPRRRSHWAAFKCITQILLVPIFKRRFWLSKVSCIFLLNLVWLQHELLVCCRFKKFLISVRLAFRTKTARLLTGFLKICAYSSSMCGLYKEDYLEMSWRAPTVNTVPPAGWGEKLNLVGTLLGRWPRVGSAGVCHCHWRGERRQSTENRDVWWKSIFLKNVNGFR